MLAGQNKEKDSIVVVSQAKEKEDGRSISLIESNAFDRWIRSHKKPLLLAGVILCFFILALWHMFYLRASMGSVVVLVSFSIVSVIGIGVLFYFFFYRALSTLWVFPLVLCLTGLLYVGLAGPLQSPDEQYHYLYGYRYSNILLGYDNGAQEGYNTTEMRVDDYEFLASSTAHQRNVDGHYGRTADNFLLLAKDPGMQSFETESFASGMNWPANGPQLRIPEALGMTVGRLLGLGAYPVFYLGRIFNFLFFALMAYAAVRITPLGKNAFMVMSLLPAVLHDVASLSYDAGIDGMAFLLVALCLRMIYGKGRLEKGNIVAFAVLLALLVPCKLIYAPLGFLACFVPTKRFASRRQAVLFRLGVPLIMLLAFGVTRFDIAGAVATNQMYSAVESRTLWGVLASPLSFLREFANTLFVRGDFYLLNMVGASLSFAENLTPVLTILPFLVLFALALSSEVRSDRIQPTLRICALVLIVGIVLACFLSIYIGFAEGTGDGTIFGVQPRYFIPLLPLVFILFSNACLASGRPSDQALLFACTVFGLVNVMHQFTMIAVFSNGVSLPL